MIENKKSETKQHLRFFQFCSFNVISDDSVSRNDFLLWLCVILAGNEDMILLEKDMRPRWNSPNKTLTALSTIFKFIFIFIFFLFLAIPKSCISVLRLLDTIGMGFQNNWYYAIFLDWSIGLHCIFFFTTLTSTVSSGHVLRRGRPGSIVLAGVSPCSCE